MASGEWRVVVVLVVVVVGGVVRGGGVGVGGGGVGGGARAAAGAVLLQDPCHEYLCPGPRLWLLPFPVAYFNAVRGL